MKLPDIIRAAKEKLGPSPAERLAAHWQKKCELATKTRLLAAMDIAYKIRGEELEAALARVAQLEEQFVRSDAASPPGSAA